LVNAKEPMHGRSSVITHSQSGIFANIPAEISVMRYHSLVLKELPSTLTLQAQTHQGEIMAMKSKVLPWWGVQFHPESILTQHGLKMVENWMVQTSKN
jgi:anthranilate/para-aminobenzoate synthase component II